jgi:uncharacterized membrane protein HdeD (DUF308 family)
MSIGRDNDMNEKTSSKEIIAFAPWWAILINGIIAIVLGGYLVTRPATTVIALALVIGWYWLLSGIIGIYLGLKDKADGKKILYGIIGALAGLVVIFHPLLTGLLVPATLIVAIGVMGVLMGAIGLFYALKRDWGAAILGLLSIVFGLLLIGSPLFALAMLAYLVGGLSIVAGLVAIYIAFKLR